MKHLTAEPRLDCIAPEYHGVIVKALAKDPEQRFRSTEEMLRAMPGTTSSAATDQAFPSSVVAAQAVSASRGGDARPTAAYPGGSGQEAKDPAITAQAVGAARQRTYPQEPIARAVYDVWFRLRRGWNSAELGIVPRILIIVILVFALITNLWIVPFGFFLGLVYAVYFLVRTLLIEVGKPQVAKLAPAPAPAPPPPVEKPARKIRRRRRPWEDLARDELSAKSPRQRLTELTGSLLMGATVCAVVCLVMMIAMMILGNEDLGLFVLSWAPVYAWMTLTSIVGTWGVLVSSKWWENSHGEASLRRFTMLAIGLLCGAAAFVLSQQVLMVQPTYVLDAPRPFHHYPTPLFEPYGTPSALAYLGYFAGLFLVLRWWKQVDPLRPGRLSIWSTFVCVLWAIVLFAFLPFPRGFMVAAAISVAVQLSSPWMPNRERKRFRQAAQEV